MENPYAAPVSDPGTGPGHPTQTQVPGDAQVTPKVLAAMQQTRPWVLFIAILGFVLAAFMGLGALAVAAAGSTFNAGPLGSSGGILVAVIYLVIAAIYAVLSLRLYRYAGAIKMLTQGYGVHALEEALEHQKSFWRMVGIMAIVTLFAYLLLIVGVVIAGVAQM